MSAKVAERMKKRDKILYDKSWMLRLAHLMGIYAMYFDSTQQFKALWILNAAISFIQKDRMNRMFVNKNTSELDYDKMMDFDELAYEFRLLFGTEPLHPGEERPLSYQDLRATRQPEPERDVVYIARRVRLIHFWSAYPAEYTALRIGFAYQVSMPGPFGPMMQNVPMFDWNDPSIHEKMTNAIPYEAWQQEKTALLNEMLPIVFELETIIAQHLHNEGFRTFNASERSGVMEGSQWTMANEDEDEPDDIEDDGVND